MLAVGHISSRTAGQRAVTLGGSVPSPIIVRDFNPYAVRVACASASASEKSQQENWSMQLPNGNRMTINVMESVLAVCPILRRRKVHARVRVIGRREKRIEPRYVPIRERTMERTLKRDGGC